MKNILIIFVLILLVACGGSSGSSNTQKERLKITNNCSYAIWIEQDNMPSDIPAIVKIDSGKSYEFTIAASGVASTRFWPKVGCNDEGYDCTIGQSSTPCPDGGCPPPVDSKLEATWGCTLSDQTNCGTDAQGDIIGDTYWNMSAVDGYTLPFTATITGNSITDANQPCENSNCADLSFDQCPTNDNLSVGQGGVVDSDLTSVDLNVFNSSSTMIGCYSPCKALNYPTYGGKGFDENSTQAIMYCCPAGITPEQCSTGPVVSTEYVTRVHTMCSDTAYAYAYDDAYGLRHCSAETKVHVTFGPNCP